jgi:gluconate 2-dehydrogenase alpha chain
VRKTAPTREDDMADDSIPRRSFLKGAGAAGAAAASVLAGPSEPAQAQAQAQTSTAAPTSAASPDDRYLQSSDASNLFVMGGAAFPQNAGHNPTATIGALTYWSAKAITEQYLKAPGPLVHG